MSRLKFLFPVARVQATRFVQQAAILPLVPPSISNTDVKILCFYLSHIKGTRIKQENQGQDQYHSHVFSGSRTINHTKRTKYKSALGSSSDNMRERPYADPEGKTGGPDHPWKITKISGFLTILVRIPLKSQSYQSSMHRPASETPFKWRFAGGPLIAPL